jgi:restriction system protein
VSVEKSYYRVMLGKKHSFVEEGRTGNFVGVDFGLDQDLKGRLPEDWKPFNREFIPIFLAKNPEKTKISAGLACGMLWTLAKGIKLRDIVLCPDGQGNYLVGEVMEEYSYHQGKVLPHRRTVRWYQKAISKADMSQSLQNSCGSIATLCEISKFGDEIEHLIGSNSPVAIVANDKTIEDPSVFALEMHLEEFLVQNWEQTELGKKYDIYEEDGGLVGQQYPTDTGPIDILAISKDKKELLVVELKKGRASDSVVGQIQRYMGYVSQELAEDHQIVKGVIIALEDHLTIRRALAVTKNIEFYRYQVNFRLFKNQP